MAMVSTQPTLGTLLRHLIESLDGAVEMSYQRSGLDYRPRYTPVVRALLETGPCSIRTISLQAKITHSAVSQTVAEMAKRDWVSMEKGEDGREKIVALTTKAQAAVPVLRRHWTATERAAKDLDSELSVPLSPLLIEAIEALDRKPFFDRIQDSAALVEVKA